jgi:hypothetical protein
MLNVSSLWNVFVEGKYGRRCVGNSSGDENGSNSMKYWEIIADRLHAEGWSYGMGTAVLTASRARERRAADPAHRYRTTRPPSACAQ